MLRKMSAWWRLATCLLLVSSPYITVLANALGGNTDVGWANPSVSTIKTMGQVSSLAETEDVYNVNYDCTPETYRFEFEPLGTMHDGCFAPTAFGQMDIANNVVQGFGFSGAIPVKAFGHEAIVPMPRAASIATVSGASPMGAYLHLYTYFPSAVQVQYDAFLRPSLQLPQQANLLLSDSAGQAIIINAQSIAFSSNSSWMVVESPWHSFLRINTATLDITPFAPSLSPVLDYSQHDSHVTITDDGRYAVVQSNEFKIFKVYDLSTCTGSATTDLKPLDCQSHDYQTFAASKIEGLGNIQHVRFVKDDLLSLHAAHGSVTETYLLAPTDSIKNFTDYLAFGDSYTSGEGAFNYLDGTDTANNMCHQSVHSYPYLLKQDVFNDGHTVACSGATINDISDKTKNYPGQVQDGIFREKRTNVDQILADFMPGYLAQWEFAQKYQPRILTVGIGGNDIGFGNILADCVAPHLKDSTCYSSYEDRKELADVIDRTYQKWVSLYRQLQATTPNTRIYAIGYPQIAATQGNCAINVHLNEYEVGFSQYLIDYLNSVIQKAANTAGINYVDISHALDGHGLCEASSASVAVNGLTAGTDKFHVLGKESYHPNALGHELIEQAILKQTNHFADFAPLPASESVPAITDDNPLLKAPKTSRNIRTLIPDSSITSDGAVRGGSLSFNINGLANNLKPRNNFTVMLHDTGKIIGTIASDEQGNISSSVQVPTDTDIGTHIIDVSGPNIADQPVDITKTVYVANDGNDSDGDGIDDAHDSCPAAPNSGQDTDQDGTDDTCDGFIGLPPVTGNTSTSDGSSGAVSSGPPGNTITTATATISNQSSTASLSHNMPVSGVVLGTKTSNYSAGETSTAFLDKFFAPKDNITVIYWQPWAIDALLFGMLLALLAKLSGSLAAG